MTGGRGRLESDLVDDGDETRLMFADSALVVESYQAEPSVCD